MIEATVLSGPEAVNTGLRMLLIQSYIGKLEYHSERTKRKVERIFKMKNDKDFVNAMKKLRSDLGYD